MAGVPSRLWVAPTGIQWDWGQHTLLVEDLTTHHDLLSARVDGQKFTAVQHHNDSTRKTQVHRARVVLTAEHTSRVQWTLSWPAVRTDSGIEATHEDHMLIGKLDPEWTWAIDGHTITGTGSSRLRCTFELR